MPAAEKEGNFDGYKVKNRWITLSGVRIWRGFFKNHLNLGTGLIIIEV